MTTLLVVLLIGATARLTQLVTADLILEPLRSRIERSLPDKLAYLIRCDWCMSVWVGLAVFTVGWYAPDTPVWIVAGGLTASVVSAWLTFIGTAIEALAFRDRSFEVEVEVEDLETDE